MIPYLPEGERDYKKEKKEKKKRLIQLYIDESNKPTKP